MSATWPGDDHSQATAAGLSGRARPVKVDARTIAAEGSVSVVDLRRAARLKEIVVGRYAFRLGRAPSDRFVVVANANSDTVSVIDTPRDEVVETISDAAAPESCRSAVAERPVFMPTATSCSSPTARITPWP